MSFLSAIWNFIKKYWWLILIIVVVVMAIYFPGALSSVWTWLKGVWASFSKWFGKLPWWGQAIVAVGGAYAIDPEGTAHFIEQAVDTVAGFATTVVGSVAKGLLSNPIFLVGAGVTLFALFRKRDDGTSIAGSALERRRARLDEERRTKLIEGAQQPAGVVQ